MTVVLRSQTVDTGINITTGGLSPVNRTINQSVGTFVANGVTPVTVADTYVTANSVIVITLKTVGGTVSPTPLYIPTITPGTGFTVAGLASDTSTYNYRIIG
jgi:hypothetical protein